MKSNKKTTLFTIAAVLAISFVFYSFTLTVTQKPWEVPAKYKAMKNTTKADAENLAIGKTLYNKHCKSCHGTKGKGDGPKAINLKTTIRSLTSDEYKKQTPGEKYYKSFVGRDEMPNFEKKIVEEEDRWYIINYMETFK